MKKVILNVILVVVFLSGMNAKSDGQNAYITNSGDNTVSVINLATNTVTATIPVGNNPFGVSVSPDGSKVYIVNSNNVPHAGTVSVINTLTNIVIATIAVGGFPIGVAVSPDGTKVYVTNQDDNTISVINAATNTVTATIVTIDNTGYYGIYPTGVSVSPDGTRVYVTFQNSPNVSVINTLTNSIIATIPTGSFFGDGICISPDGTKVYVGNTEDYNVSVINTATNIVTATIPLGFFVYPTALAVSPDGTKVYVADYGDNYDADKFVSVINTATNTVTANITVGQGSQGISISPDGTIVYVANSTDNTVSVINTLTNTVTATIAVGLYPVAFGNFISRTPCPTLAETLTPNGPTAFCQGGSVTLDAGVHPSYLWSDGSMNETLVATTSGMYSVTVTNPTGCPSTGHHAVTVYVNPVPVILAANVCSGFGTLSVGASFPAYNWNTTAITQSISNLSDGSYTVTVTNIKGCTGSASTNVTTDCYQPTFPAVPVTNLTAISAKVNWIQPYCYFGYTIRISGHNANVWTSYTITPNTHYQFLNLSRNTSYDWQIQTNCNASGSANSGFTDIQTFTTSARLADGESDNYGHSFNVYPNPTNTQAIVSFIAGTEDVYSIRLIDVTGRIIQYVNYTSVIGENQYQLNLSQVAKGIYTVILQNGVAVLQNKIVVQ